MSEFDIDYVFMTYENVFWIWPIVDWHSLFQLY